MFGNHVNKKLSAYCHGELSNEEERRTAEHLLHCRRCRKAYDEIRSGAGLAAQIKLERTPASLWTELEIKLGQIELPTPQPEKRSLFAQTPFKLAAGLAAALLLFTLFALRFYNRQRGPDPPDKPSSAPFWEVARIDGHPKIAERVFGDTGKLVLGEWLVTDDSSRAQISVGEIGEVQVEPNSRIRLLQARDDEHRLALSRGKLRAFIWAPPGKFFVDTPSAIAVDLGCSYTLEMNDDGQGLLHVTSGWVAFEWERRESFVPAEAECVTRPLLGPGTPYFNDASIEFQNSLAVVDTTKPDDLTRTAALDTVLRRARKRDALTLWHLLTRTSDIERGRVYDRLALLTPPPRGVTRAGVVGGDRAMIDKWWDKLGLGDTDWWRMWKGPVPSNTK